MKFKVERTSDFDYEEQIDISSLEELIKFIEENDEDIIIKPPKKFTNDTLYCIEIYDTWRE